MRTALAVALASHPWNMHDVSRWLDLFCRATVTFPQVPKARFHKVKESRDQADSTSARCATVSRPPTKDDIMRVLKTRSFAWCSGYRMMTS